MIKKSLEQFLKTSKNLLAFSGGVDSTALFFILKKLEIEFDIAIVDYGLRKEAYKEIEYAKSLAKEYNKRIFIKRAPKFSSNFEANAREFRYSFFKEIIKKHNYKSLITAHQLNDKIEWFLMRFSKGAGVSELSGMSKIEEKDEFFLLRPLLDISKDELIYFLEQNKIKYFIDKSNFDKKFERNRFREIANILLKENKKDGFIRSFNILENQKKLFLKQFEIVLKEKELIILNVKKEFKSEAASFALKKLGYVISYKDREVILQNDSVVIGREWVVEYKNNLLYIAPYIKVVMPKRIKEFFRVLQIPPKVRGYIFKNINFNNFLDRFNIL